MLHQKSGTNYLSSKLKNLKQSIRQKIENQLLNKDGFNQFHNRIIKADYDDILITNYDYSLQKSVCNHFFEIKKKLALNGYSGLS